jgi:hypothetical protein
VEGVDYEPHTLERWTLPDSYGGEHWPEYFVFLAQHRDSDALARSNFICGLKAIGGESETVHIVRERHWAVGWVEWIAIHQDDAAALEKADSVAAALTDYPVVSDDHWSELEYTEAADYWERMSIRDRIDYCARAGISIFAARRDYLPPDDTGALLELLRD